MRWYYELARFRWFYEAVFVCWLARRLRSLDHAVVKESIFRVRRSVSAAAQLSCIGISLLCTPPRIAKTLFGAMDVGLCRLNLALAALYIVPPRSPLHRIALTPLFCFLPACIVPVATEDLSSHTALSLPHCF